LQALDLLECHARRARTARRLARADGQLVTTTTISQQFGGQQHFLRYAEGV